MSETEHRLSFARLIARISARFVATRVADIDQTISTSLQEIGEFFHADRSYIFEFSDHLEFADNTYEWCAEGIEPVINELKNIPMTGYDAWIDSWFAGGSIPIADVFELPEGSPERQLLEPQGIRALIMVPLPSESSLLGMFGIDLTRKPYHWPQEQVALLQVVGEIIAGAIQRKYSNDSHRLRELVAKLAVRFINLPTDAVEQAIVNSLLQIKELLDFSALEFLREPPAIAIKLLEETQRKVLRIAPENLPKYASPEHAVLIVRAQSFACNFGVIVAVHSSHRLFRDSRILESLVLIADLIAGSLARGETERQVERLAYFDELTGLPNRAMFVRYLSNVMSSAKKEPHVTSHAAGSSSVDTAVGAMLFMDLDHFKRSNDNLGRDFGDQILIETAKRISAQIQPNELVARLAGDQFLVYLHASHGDLPQLSARIESIYQELNKPYRIAGHIYHGSVSVGALHCRHATSVEEILNLSEMAMHAAKSKGRNLIEYYNPKIQENAIARAALYDELREAIDTGQFVVYFQPQMDSLGVVVGCEALVRWQHPYRGLLSPSEFIEFAEETKLIVGIGRCVLETACNAIHELASLGFNYPVSVNISAEQMYEQNFVTDVIALLRAKQIPPERLCIELTESSMIKDTNAVTACMHDLRAAGVSFSLDDFGTGYSSLAYLKSLPIQEIKLDLRFVRDMLRNSQDAAIAKLVFALARELEMDVIAEGVETQEQYEFLRDMGCKYFQGYLFSPALPFEQLVQFNQQLR
ncbi:MAG: GGDEF domain-containing protein [Firmicutes bacterium]|nr:GGDEF domain-containing protein [Bacillota bacterium]